MPTVCTSRTWKYGVIPCTWRTWWRSTCPTIFWYSGSGHESSLPCPLPRCWWRCWLLQRLLHPGTLALHIISFCFFVSALLWNILVLPFNVFSSQLAKMMCSRGYSLQVPTYCSIYFLQICDSAMVCNLSSFQFSGICGSLLLGTGFVGAIFTGILVERFSIDTNNVPSWYIFSKFRWLQIKIHTHIYMQIQFCSSRFGRMEEVAKVFYGFAGIFGILIAEFMRFGDVAF